MSAGRLEWTATRWEHKPEGTVLIVRVFAHDGRWAWSLSVNGSRGYITRGEAGSSSAAKGAARTALDEYRGKAATK